MTGGKGVPSSPEASPSFVREGTFPVRYLLENEYYDLSVGNRMECEPASLLSMPVPCGLSNQERTGGRRTVCANIHNGKILFWHRSIIEPRGACVVSARIADHTDEDGWTIRRFPTIDTFFKTR